MRVSRQRLGVPCLLAVSVTFAVANGSRQPYLARSLPGTVPTCHVFFRSLAIRPTLILLSASTTARHSRIRERFSWRVRPFRMCARDATGPPGQSDLGQFLRALQLRRRLNTLRPLLSHRPRVLLPDGGWN